MDVTVHSLHSISLLTLSIALMTLLSIVQSSYDLSSDFKKLFLRTLHHDFIHAFSLLSVIDTVSLFFSPFTPVVPFRTQMPISSPLMLSLPDCRLSCALC